MRALTQANASASAVSPGEGRAVAAGNPMGSDPANPSIAADGAACAGSPDPRGGAIHGGGAIDWGTASAGASSTSGDVYVINWGRWATSALDGRWVALIVGAVYAGLFVNMLASSPWWSPFSTVDEQVTYYQVARNFLRYGFTPTLFLHDVSTASSPALHPFVYNHMPPGPEIFTALVMTLVGEHYTAIRFVLGLIFFAGLLCFLRVTRTVLDGFGLTGAGFAVLFLTPFTMLHSIDHPAYSPFALFAFLPLVLVDRHYRTLARWPLWIAVAVVFLSSVYLVYQNLFMLVTAWVLLGRLQILRLDRRHVVAFALAAALGIALHATQSVLLFGPWVFAKETALALANRAIGIPSMAELTAFYRSLDLVHHGGHRLDLLALGAALLSTLRLAEPTLTRSWTVGEMTITGGVLLAFLLWGGSRLGRFNWRFRTLTIPRDDEALALIAAARRFGALGLWVAGIIVVPLLMFPAYSVDYGLSGMGEYFLAILMVAVYAFAGSRWIAWWPALRQADPAIALGWPAVRQLVPAVLLFALGLWSLHSTVAVWHSRLWAASWLVPDSNPDASDLVELGQALKGKVVMTNVYPTTVGFFTEEAALGGCERAVFRGDGGLDPTQCHLIPIRGIGRGLPVRPTHYVLFREKHLTGFTRCRDACLHALHQSVSDRYPVVLTTRLYTIFDVTRTRPST